MHASGSAGESDEDVEELEDPDFQVDELDESEEEDDDFDVVEEEGEEDRGGDGEPNRQLDNQEDRPQHMADTMSWQAGAHHGAIGSHACLSMGLHMRNQH